VDVDWPAAGSLLAYRYRLIALLETGGMAQIWSAEDERLGRPVALKLPTNADASSAELLRLAWKEARTAARLSHPHIAAVHDCQETVRPDGSVAPFVVMELLDGETLAARLDRSPLTWQEAAGVAAAVADALAAAHARGVVHRDIKPGNVMLTHSGVKILDFGISAATGEPDDDETGATFGTPAYVAPERFDGKPAEPGTDVYGLGVLLFEMVTGQPPHPVDTWEELAAARAAGRVQLPPGLPVAFRALVFRCLDDEPGRRPTAADVHQALALLAPPAGVTGTPEIPATFAAGRAPAVTISMSDPGQRRTAIRVGVVVAAVAIIGIVAAIDSPPRTDNAEQVPPATTLAPSAAPFPSPSPSSAPGSGVPVAPETTRIARTSEPPAPLEFDDAVSRMRSAVESGQAAGQIRPDVATDLLNLLGPLGGADAQDIDRLVDELRRKIDERIDEGSVAAAQAAVLQSRLSDLDMAAGT
jgi:serine/threonine-protein kinase